MREIRGNIWSPMSFVWPNTCIKVDLPKLDAVCITTNGTVKQDGCGVMGRGVALQAKERFPGIDRELGTSIRQHGNNVAILRQLPSNLYIVSFPVKPTRVQVLPNGSNLVRHVRQTFKAGSSAPGWASKALPSIIERSAMQLKNLADTQGWTAVVTVRPGCANGELEWEEVRKILERVLDDRFYVISP